MDPARRLQRRFPGERIAREGRGIERLFAREAPDPRPAPVPSRDRTARAALTRRDTAQVAACRPNAPLLIRIVRYPFALSTTRGERRKYREDPPRLERLDWSAQVKEALADRLRLRFTSAARGRPLPFVVRPSSWILVPPQGAPPKPGEDR